MVSLAYKNRTWIVKKFSGRKVIWTIYAKGLKDAMGIVREIKKSFHEGSQNTSKNTRYKKSISK